MWWVRRMVRGVVRGVVVFCDSLWENRPILRYVAATLKKKVVKKNGIMKFIFKLFLYFLFYCALVLWLHQALMSAVVYPSSFSSF